MDKKTEKPLLILLFVSPILLFAAVYLFLFLAYFAAVLILGGSFPKG